MNRRNDALHHWVNWIYDRILRASLVLTSDLVSAIRARIAFFILKSFAEASVNTKILEWCGVPVRAICTWDAQTVTHFQENLEMLKELANLGWLGFFCLLGTKPVCSSKNIFTFLCKIDQIYSWRYLWDYLIFQSDMYGGAVGWGVCVIDPGLDSGPRSIPDLSPSLSPSFPVISLPSYLI